MLSYKVCRRQRPVLLTAIAGVALVVKNPPASAGDVRKWVGSLVWEDPLQEGMATHCSILACRIPRTEELGRLQSLGSKNLDTTEAT